MPIQPIPAGLEPHHGFTLNLFRRFLPPVLVLAIAGTVGVYLLKTGPEPKRKAPKPVVFTVEVVTVKPQSHPVWVRSQGVMAPRLRSALTSETAGRLVEVSDHFIPGAFFEEGALLARIDPESYRLQLANLEASLGTVEARLAELATTRDNLEKSLTIESQQLKLAERQFERLTRLFKEGTVAESGLEKSENELLQHRTNHQNLKNTLALIPAKRRNLKAEWALKRAQRDAARLDLERTRIRAPFAGRVLTKQTDLGQFVAKGAVLGEVYALGSWEVRLPISDRQLALLDLSGLENRDGIAERGPRVRLTAGEGVAGRRWLGRVVRVEAAVDARSRQVVLSARVDPSADRGKSNLDWLDGRFVTAAIEGRTLESVFVLPRHAVGPGDRVMVITHGNRLQRRTVDIRWRDGGSVAVESGLKAGERISITPLPYAPDGTPVKIMGADGGPEDGQKPGARRKKREP